MRIRIDKRVDGQVELKARPGQEATIGNLLHHRGRERDLCQRQRFEFSGRKHQATAKHIALKGVRRGGDDGRIERNLPAFCSAAQTQAGRAGAVRKHQRVGSIRIGNLDPRAGGEQIAIVTSAGRHLPRCEREREGVVTGAAHRAGGAYLSRDAREFRLQEMRAVEHAVETKAQALDRPVAPVRDAQIILLA